ncbi:Rv1733c family protein [Nocardia jejuensis]|uniref:Rv1733c family protein n=1 Tax=Nocardia jejuensis TaxID=328049 RepID=UPI000A8A7642|nr:hypothetical protein [Nocardia jejuensis]
MPQYPSRLTRMRRTLPWRRTPLMRRSDRLEMVVRMLAVLLVVLAVPVAVLVGRASHSELLARIRHEDSGKISVSATVLADPAHTPIDAAVPPGPPRAWVRWEREGHVSTAMVEVPSTAKAGDRLTQWVGTDGKPANPPRSPRTAAIGATGTALTTLLTTWLGIGIVLWSALCGFGHYRSVRWAREWSAISPAIRDRKQHDG